MTRPLVVLGTGGGALDILDLVGAINAVSARWEVVGFLDDAQPAGGEFLGLPSLGPTARAAALDPAISFVNAIGSDRSHARRPELVASTGLGRERFATLIHPYSSVSPRASLGRGVVVGPGVSVGGRAVVGDHASLSPGCIVGHDAAIDDFALLAPGAIVSGFVRVGRAAYVGAGACIRQRIRIGERALVGMGAVVVRDVEAGNRVVGCPARPMPARAAGQHCTTVAR